MPTVARLTPDGHTAGYLTRVLAEYEEQARELTAPKFRIVVMNADTGTANACTRWRSGAHSPLCVCVCVRARAETHEEFEDAKTRLAANGAFQFFTATHGPLQGKGLAGCRLRLAPHCPCLCAGSVESATGLAVSLFVYDPATQTWSEHPGLDIPDQKYHIKTIQYRGKPRDIPATARDLCTRNTKLTCAGFVLITQANGRQFAHLKSVCVLVCICL